LQLDLFVAQPDNWGLTLLVRMGSAAFGPALLARWKRRQGLGHDQPGTVDGRLVTRDGRVVPTPEEEKVSMLSRTDHLPSYSSVLLPPSIRPVYSNNLTGTHRLLGHTSGGTMQESVGVEVAFSA
jgi:hypothetical protein